MWWAQNINTIKFKKKKTNLWWAQKYRKYKTITKKPCGGHQNIKNIKQKTKKPCDGHKNIKIIKQKKTCGGHKCPDNEPQFPGILSRAQVKDNGRRTRLTTNFGPSFVCSHCSFLTLNLIVSLNVFLERKNSVCK